MNAITLSQVTLVASSENTKVEEEAPLNTNKARYRPQKKILNSFDPQLITHLDLSYLNTGRHEIFLNGCLPEWIQNFQNLEELNAAGLGIVILEPWLLNLSQLAALDLEQNQIGTWPSFLSESNKIQTVILDGNPCLEKAFQKSPTLRSLYFSWNATDYSKTIPSYIRGPEWHIASSARSSSSINIDNLGFFCGGIYGLATRPDENDDGYLTPIEPCPVMARKFLGFRSVQSGKNMKPPHKAPLYKEEGKRQATIIREIFDDVALLKNRYAMKRTKTNQKFVLLVGSMKDECNRLLKDSAKRLNLDDMKSFSVKLLHEEELYINQLKTVEKEFYYTRKIRSTTISCCFREVFSEFPVMDILHTKAILPALKRFVQALGFSQIRRKNPRYVPEFSVGSTIVDLCTAFRKLQLAMQKYSENLWQTEHHLDLRNSPTKMYQDAEFKSYVEKQIVRLAGMGGGITVADLTPTVELKSFYGEDGKDVLSSDKHILAEWIYKQAHKTKKDVMLNCADFVYLPLLRLVRYERFFTSFAGTDQSYQPLLRVLRRLRKCCANKIEHSRKHVRIHVLSVKFRTSSAYFQRYRWDAVVTIHSRGYLEPGILSLNTNDVIDHDGNSASFIKETFVNSRLRILRMVACGNDILIWDEVFEHLICKISKSNIIAVPSKDDRVRIVFLTVRETCLIQVKDFNAKYFTPNHPNQEFIEALSSKSEKKIL